MDFRRGDNILKTLDIGWERKLKKGDKFIFVVPAIKDNPEREEIAITIEDEFLAIHEGFIRKIQIKDKVPLFEVKQYKIRVVKWEIPKVASGYAYMKENCEHPRWILSTRK